MRKGLLRSPRGSDLERTGPSTQCLDGARSVGLDGDELLLEGRCTSTKRGARRTKTSSTSLPSKCFLASSVFKLLWTMSLSPGCHPCGVATFSRSVSCSESMQRKISLNWRPVEACVRERRKEESVERKSQRAVSRSRRRVGSSRSCETRRTGYWSERRTRLAGSMTKTVRTVKGMPLSSRLVKSCLRAPVRDRQRRVL